jgi:ketosteroid isomerase-like protein
MARKLLFIFLLITTFALSAPLRNSSSTNSSPLPDSSLVESEIHDAIRERLAALRRQDAAAYASFFAPDCLLTSDDGALSKPQDVTGEWSANYRAGIIFHGSDALDLEVHSYGELAVAAFRLELDEDWSGQKVMNAFRYTNVFAHRNGRWLLIASQETAIPNARRLAAKVDPAFFDSYAGEYELTPRYLVKVKREGDQLMELWPGDTSFVTDIPVDQSTFVSRGAAGEIIYAKNSAGKVTHFIYRTAGGDLIARKK